VTITYGALFSQMAFTFHSDGIDCMGGSGAGFVFPIGVAAGLIHIRRYRIASTPIASIPYTSG